MELLEAFPGEWIENKTGNESEKLLALIPNLPGIVKCTDVSRTVLIIVVFGLINTLIKLTCKCIDQYYNFFTSENFESGTSIKQRFRYYIKSIFYDGIILMAFTHSNISKRLSSVIGTLFSFKPLASLISDLLHIYYRASTINEGWKLDSFGLTMILSLSFLETVVHCYILIKLNRHEAEIFTNLTIKPMILLSEFIYFDRQVEETSLLFFAYFLTLFDLFKTIVEDEIIQTMLDCADHLSKHSDLDLLDFSDYNENLKAYQSNTQSTSVEKSSKLKQHAFKIITNNQKSKSSQEGETFKQKVNSIWIDTCLNTRYKRDVSKTVMFYAISANSVIDFNRTFYFFKSLYPIFGNFRSALITSWYEPAAVIQSVSCSNKSYLETFNHRTFENPSLNYNRSNQTYNTISGTPMSLENVTLAEQERQGRFNDFNEWDCARTVLLTVVVFLHYSVILLGYTMQCMKSKNYRKNNLYEKIVTSLYKLNKRIHFVYVILVLVVVTFSVNLIPYDLGLMKLNIENFGTRPFINDIKMLFFHLIFFVPVIYKKSTVLIINNPLFAETDHAKLLVLSVVGVTTGIYLILMPSDFEILQKCREMVLLIQISSGVLNLSYSRINKIIKESQQINELKHSLFFNSIVVFFRDFIFGNLKCFVISPYEEFSKFVDVYSFISVVFGLSYVSNLNEKFDYVFKLIVISCAGLYFIQLCLNICQPGSIHSDSNSVNSADESASSAHMSDNTSSLVLPEVPTQSNAS